MISVEQASALINKEVQDFGAEVVHLSQSCGRVLVNAVYADRDFPPYNRVMMDGVAVHSNDFFSGLRNFKIEKTQSAGSPVHTLQSPNHCIEVMTGSVLPENTDIIIPYEQCDVKGDNVTIKTDKATVMQHVHVKGTDSKKGDLLLKEKERITPAAISVLASVGLSEVAVIKFPKITICSTGDELVDVAEQPLPFQVRRSNVYMLAAALLTEGIPANTVHLPDNEKEMFEQISAMITVNHVILFSGAVSKGKFDFLPAVLKKLQINLVFHNVLQKPGKPFLFGKFPNGTLVFGFPGNPVSTFVCYHQFFKHWLHLCMQYKSKKYSARLTEDVRFEPKISNHLLVNVVNQNGEMLATPVYSSTSGDLIKVTKANGILTLPADREIFSAGEEFTYNPVT